MTREDLNEKARVDYGITNAADMSDKQLKDEMLTVDKQHPDYKAPGKANKS